MKIKEQKQTKISKYQRLLYIWSTVHRTFNSQTDKKHNITNKYLKCLKSRLCKFVSLVKLGIKQRSCIIRLIIIYGQAYLSISNVKRALVTIEV